MSTISECKKLLKRYSIARIPFVVVDTIENARALSILKKISEEQVMPFYVHSLSKGFYDIVTEKIISEDNSLYGAMDFMKEQMQRKQYQTYILTDVPDISADNSETKQFLSVVNLANESGSMVIVFTNNPVWIQLQRLGMRIRLDNPDETEMYHILCEYINDYRNDIPIEWDTNDMREAASLLAGITKIEAENIIGTLLAKKQITKKDMDEIRFAKDRLYTDISGLEKVQVDENEKDIGGLEGLQKWLNEKKELLKPEKRDEMKKRGLKSPRGIMLVGVPGCGKSLSAKTIAIKWKLPLYRLDFATVQGMYVGQSEQQLKDALTMAENVAPCILWIDEIEKGLSGAKGSLDGGVSTRMVGQFLFWLQECRKQVFVVATANDVSMLPAELLRRGRFDELFFVDLPTAEERREIISLYMRKYLNLDFSGPLADQIIADTEGFAGSDLESAVRELAYRTVANKDFVLTEDAVLATFDNVVPLSQTSPERIEAIRAWGRERAVPASGKPIGSEVPEKKKKKLRKVLI